jgi:hypothetical protein
MTNKESSTSDQVFSKLCGSVDHWKRRALKAEATIQQEREDEIKAAGLWKEFSFVLGYLGAQENRTCTRITRC